MKSVGIIDLGSNSLKLLIAEVREDNVMNVLCEKKHQIKLSDYYIDDRPNLSPIGVYKLIYSIQMFLDKCKFYQCENVIAVATETLRKCANKKAILNEIKKETGLDIKILSGYEESYLGYISTINTLNYKNYFLIDMGGASVEIALIKNRKFKYYASLPLGPIPLSSRFNLFNKISPSTKAAFKKFLYKEFVRYPWLKQGRNLPIISIGGSMKNIAQIDICNNTGFIGSSLHNYQMTYSNLSFINNQICSLDYNARVNIKGVSKKRADVICASSNFIKYFMLYTHSKRIIINNYGIREGIFFSFIKNKN